MPNSKIPSPAKSQGSVKSSQRHKPNRSRSVCSPGPSNPSGRLTSVIDEFKNKDVDSPLLSPIRSRLSVLTNKSDIEVPSRKSWWKNLNEDSRDIMEALDKNKITISNNPIEKLIEIDVLSQEEKNYTLELSDNSVDESVKSIVLSQRRLFYQKEKISHNKFDQIVEARETVAQLHESNTIYPDKTVNAGTKNFFQITHGSKPAFPAALLNMSNITTANKTKENIAAEKEVPHRNIFASKPRNRRKNIFANFILTESDDEVPDIQPKLFEFRKQTGMLNHNSIHLSREHSPTSSISSDTILDDWRQLASSTMVNKEAGTSYRSQSDISSPSKEQISDEQVNQIDDNSKAAADNNETKKKDDGQNKKLNSEGQSDEFDNQLSNEAEVCSKTQIAFGEQNKEQLFENKATTLDNDMNIDINNSNQEENSENLSTKRNNEISLANKVVELSSKSELGNRSDNHIVANQGSKGDADMNKEIKLANSNKEDIFEQQLNDCQERESDKNVNVTETRLSQKSEKTKSTIFIGNTNMEHDSNENSLVRINQFEEVEQIQANDEEANPTQKICNDLEESEKQDDKNNEYESQDSKNTDKSQEIIDELEESENDDDECKEDESQESEDTDKSHEIDNELEESENEDDEINQHESQDSDDADEGEEIDNQLEDGNYEGNENNENLKPENTDKILKRPGEAEKTHELNNEEVCDQICEEMEVDYNEEEETSKVEEEDLVEKSLNKILRNADNIPEIVLDGNINQQDTFIDRGREMPFRKTKSMYNDLSIRPSLAPTRDCLRLADDTGQSSAEDSAWDSHRTTRKTLRQTFGRDFTPRKSLRTLVLQKTAKLTDCENILNSETINLPQLHSTNYPDNIDEDNISESENDVSRQDRLTTKLQQIRQQNLEEQIKIRDEVRNSYKRQAALNSPIIFKVPSRPAPRKVKPTGNKRKQQTLSNIFGELPPEAIDDLKYKPPKRFKPRGVSWITNRLYKFLEDKLEPKYDYKTRVRAEKLMETIYDFTKSLSRKDVASVDAVNVLKHELARLNIVKTHCEFYEFFFEYMPREIRMKVVPDIVNRIPLPRKGISSDILGDKQS